MRGYLDSAFSSLDGPDRSGLYNPPINTKTSGQFSVKQTNIWSVPDTPTRHFGSSEAYCGGTLVTGETHLDKSGRSADWDLHEILV